MVATRRRFNPNLQKVRIDVGGTPTREYVCTRCLKAGKVETNIVIFEVDDPTGVVQELWARDVWMGTMGPGRIRAVTHLDVDRAGIETALRALEEVLG